MVVYGDFEWDDDKAAKNLSKHGIAFAEAATAVIDPNALFLQDETDQEEERFRVIGRSSKANILLVVVVERGSQERLISARLATEKEEELYFYEG